MCVCVLRVNAGFIFCPVWTTQISEGAGAAFCHLKKYKQTGVNCMS